MELLRDYEAMRWWAILAVFAVLYLTNLLAHAIFGAIWRALPSGPDLSFLYYVVPAAWETYEGYAACGYPEIGSFYAALLFFNAFGVVALDLALVRVIGQILPIYKSKRLTSRAIFGRCFLSFFWSFLLLGAIFMADFDMYDCRMVGEPGFGRGFMRGLMVAALALVAIPALRNSHRAG